MEVHTDQIEPLHDNILAVAVGDFPPVLHVHNRSSGVVRALSAKHTPTHCNASRWRCLPTFVIKPNYACLSLDVSVASITFGRKQPLNFSRKVFNKHWKNMLNFQSFECNKTGKVMCGENHALRYKVVCQFHDNLCSSNLCAARERGSLLLLLKENQNDKNVKLCPSDFMKFPRQQYFCDMAGVNRKEGLPLISTDFEVFGKVQGVYFRKHTQRKATELGLKGWVMNTAQGTVIGQLQGPRGPIEDMKMWLQKVGSPKSKIEKAAFRNEGSINSCAFRTFEIRR